MSNSKMLIDASHPEETRVVVLKGNRVEEFDFEAANKRQLRGNIYLAKVTRVEPSLQAAFVEYGGNRHGFLAFSEIHPDYYQIPVADRQALLDEEARAHRDEDEEPREARSEGRPREARRDGGDAPRAEGGRDGGRGGRGERGQRRSRRHRRRDASPLERRDPADESVSEVAGAEDVLGAATADAGSEAADGLTAAALPDAPAGDAPAAPALDEGSAVGGDAETPAAVEPAEEESRAEVRPVADIDAPAPAAAAEADRAPDAEASAVEAPAAGPAEAEDPAAPSGEPAALAEPADASEADAPVEAAAGAGDEPSTFPTAAAEALDAADQPEDEPHEEEHVEQIGGDALSDVAPRPVRLRRHYKIQEVIKRRQILLVQVVKEERGNKGAALTTYLSLAGRYSVLMPNTAKGGGISRKITDGEDRKRLKAIAGELDVPEGMGVILRTAGASRSPVEVRRDFEYLLRMWESVRGLTLKSSAPTLVYEEGSLIKRSIRDLFSKEVEEIVVSGEAGFAEARDFMRMLMPGNVNSVLPYRDPSPIFAKSGVEAQLDAMFSAHVTLKSGGYLVINQTEALVAIDVNSGRSTREHNIEDTALRTNLEAADEVARQLRLRDLAGLIVVDFIDMEEGRNNRSVERRLKDALKNDRARIQIGRISHFGLLEMSRQRIRTGVLEGSTVVCPHCAGAGTVRSTASIALHVLRLVEDALIRDAAFDLVVRSRAEVALYMLNQKRATLMDLEARFGVTITVAADASLTGMAYHAIERGDLASPAAVPAPRPDLVRVDSVAPIFDEVEEAAAEAEDEEAVEAESPERAPSEAGAEGGRRRRRRRRRGRDRDADLDAPQGAEADAAAPAAIGFSAEPPADEAPPEAEGEPAPVAEDAGVDAPAIAEAAQPAPEEPVAAAEPSEPAASAELATPAEPAAPRPGAAEPEPDAEPAEPPKRRRSRRTAARAEEAPAPEEAAGEAVAEAAARPRRRRAARPKAAEAEAGAEAAVEAPKAVGTEAAEADPTAPAPAAETAAVPAGPALDEPAAAEPAAAEAGEPEAAAAAAEAEPARPKRSGWWQRAKAPFSA